MTGQKQQSQEPALSEGSNENTVQNDSTSIGRRRRPPRNADTSHLSDASWEHQSPDPRDRRGG